MIELDTIVLIAICPIISSIIESSLIKKEKEGTAETCAFISRMIAVGIAIGKVANLIKKN